MRSGELSWKDAEFPHPSRQRGAIDAQACGCTVEFYGGANPPAAMIVNARAISSFPRSSFAEQQRHGITWPTISESIGEFSLKGS